MFKSMVEERARRHLPVRRRISVIAGIGGPARPMRHNGKTLSVCLLAAALAAVSVAAAYGFDEPGNLPENHTAVSPETCPQCHVQGAGGSTGCIQCHPFSGIDAAQGKGPHGLYSASTSRCDACHGIHVAGGSKLLSAATITDSCNVCHDGTGGRGVYGTIKARTGVEAQAQHRVDTTSVVPGGDAATGGSSTMTFRGENGTLGCADCHSPHDGNTVAAFPLERWRSSYDTISYRGYKGNMYLGLQTNRLLRKHPGDSETTVTAYGSDWCLGCHAGRASGTPLHNHPVDSTASTATPFTYANVARLSSDDPTSATTLGALAYTNRGYLMPYPRTTGANGQNAHKPICQQCHEDSRYVGDLSAAGDVGDAATFQIMTPDGGTATDNPRFQNFPHEAQNPRLLVETDDNLCLNCHPPSTLP